MERVKSVVGGFVLRLLIVYFVIYIFPFPLSYVPGVNLATKAYGSGLEQVVIWVGDNVLGVDATTVRTGSGDTTHRWVRSLLFLVFASLGALGWTIASRARPVNRRLLDGFLVYVQIYLACILLSYGWHKLIPVQFSSPGPDRLVNTFGQTSPMGLVWTFMGTSASYQMFGGFGEVLAGLLLFWRRTRLLGAMIGAAVMAQVVALNFSYDVPVKLGSSHYLFMALIVMSRDANRLVAVFWTNKPVEPSVLEPFPIERRWVRNTYLTLKLLLLAYFTLFQIFENYSIYDYYSKQAEVSPIHGFYKTESINRGGLEGKAIEDNERWVRVGIDGRSQRLGAVRAHGFTRRYQFDLDDDASTMTIYWDNELHVLQLDWPEDDLLRLVGELEGDAFEVRLRRVAEEDASLLTTRGFHWINEYPFNW